MQKREPVLAKWLAILLLPGCFIPFLILCFYCFPEVDDFSFANITDSYGYVGAQIHWYTTWTGRYFSTAILSFSPILLRSFFLYQVVSLSLFLGTLHSLYFLTRSLSPNTKRGHSFLLALAVVLSYLLFLPDITEAFYWFPGSATYQLASIFTAYLLGLAIRQETVRPIGKRRWVWMSILAFAAVGCNEVAMAATALSVTVYYGLYLLRERNFFNERLWVLVATAVGSAMLVFAPGNALRAEGDIGERNFNQIWEALSLTFADTTNLIGQWFWMPIVPLIILAMLGFSGHSAGRIRWSGLIATVVLVFILILAVIFPTYYIYKIPPPLRTQNFSYWIMILGAVSVGWFLSPLLSARGSIVQGARLYYGIIGFLIVAFIFPGYNGVGKAYADLSSGSARAHKNQYMERRELIASCTTPVCTVPAYSVFPFNTFNSDLDTDSNEWWNILYGKYNGGKGVSIDYTGLRPVYSQTLHFDPSETFMENYHLENLSDSMSYDGRYSYHMAPEVLYGGGVGFSADSLGTRFGNQLAYLEMGAYAAFVDSIRDLHLVAVISRPGVERPMSWSSVTWENAIREDGGWWHTQIRIPLYSLDLNRGDQFKIFLWNPNGRDVYVDELSYSLF